MRAVGDTGRIAGHLDARDVALDAIHVDHGAGRAIFAGDFGGEGGGHRVDSGCAVALRGAPRGAHLRVTA
jgi:hypothetical protein